jgi:hypothetical protein
MGGLPLLAVIVALHYLCKIASLQQPSDIAPSKPASSSGEKVALLDVGEITFKPRNPFVNSRSKPLAFTLSILVFLGQNPCPPMAHSCGAFSIAEK